MDNLINAVKKWVNSGEYSDFYWIFYEEDHLTFDQVNELCIKYGRPYPSWLTTSTKNILYNIRSIIDDYINGESSCTLSNKYHFPRTSLQSILSLMNVMRTREEATKNRIDHPFDYSNLLGWTVYAYGDKKFNFRSSYELAFMQTLIHDSNVANIEYECDWIPYIDPDGLERHYIPDFKVSYNTGSIIVYEVKPEDQLDDDLVIIKAKAAKEYYNKLGIEYRFITESDIDWDSYPDYMDPNVLNKSQLDESTDQGFITKIKTGEYTYKDHPRSNLEISYKSIMDWIKSYPPYTLTTWDVYDRISRNTLICRLRDEAPGYESDIRYWMCLYLKEDSLPSTVEFTKIKLKLQSDGIRNFHLRTESDIKDHLYSLNRITSLSDIWRYLGYSRNKGLKYCYESLEIDPYEVIEEVNNKFEVSSKSI